jgi:hypothetical protein
VYLQLLPSWQARHLSSFFEPWLVDRLNNGLSLLPRILFKKVLLLYYYYSTGHFQNRGMCRPGTGSLYKLCPCLSSWFISPFEVRKEARVERHPTEVQIWMLELIGHVRLEQPEVPVSSAGMHLGKGTCDHGLFL